MVLHCDSWICDRFVEYPKMLITTAVSRHIFIVEMPAASAPCERLIAKGIGEHFVQETKLAAKGVPRVKFHPRHIDCSSGTEEV